MSTPATPMDLFVGLSAVLTGIDGSKLAPGFDPVDIKQSYFDIAQKNGGATFGTLMTLFQDNQALSPAEIGKLIANQPDPSLRYLARSITLAWYLGSWYPPEALQTPPAAGPIPSTVISSLAYTEGWALRVAQAHPMGHSNLTFGYWTAPPPALADFVNGDPS